MRAPTQEEVSVRQGPVAHSIGDVFVGWRRNSGSPVECVSGSPGLALIAIPKIRVADGELIVGKTGLARASLSQQRRVFLIQRAVNVRSGAVRNGVNFAKLIAGLALKPLLKPGLICMEAAALPYLWLSLTKCQ